jgi:hypothetical protein
MTRKFGRFLLAHGSIKEGNFPLYATVFATDNKRIFYLEFHHLLQLEDTLQSLTQAMNFLAHFPIRQT